MRKIRIFLQIFVVLLIVGCAERKVVIENSAIVSIAPLKPLVENILGDDFEVSVLVPQGASPETFEPTPRQLRDIETARFVFGTGLLEFEQSLLHRIARKEQIVNLSQGIELIQGSCSHTHSHNHNHSHGTDPHIWCSPKSLGVMAENAYNAVVREMPDSTKYEERYTTLCIKLLELDEEVAERLRSSAKSHFVIYHPSLTYLARDYNLTQIAIEQDGKEPSAKRLAEIIELCRAQGIDHILYQAEFPRSSVEVLCRDTGATAVQINPLEEDVFATIASIVTLITE